LASISEINRYFYQKLRDENIDEIDLITAARWLDEQGLLKDALQRPGLPLRKMLRSGKINGAFQYPNRRWVIRKSAKEPGYSVKEAAAELGLSEHAIYKRIERGLLIPEKFGPKSFVISREELLRQQKEYSPAERTVQSVHPDDQKQRSAQPFASGTLPSDQISSIKQQLLNLQSQLIRVITNLDHLTTPAPPSNEKQEPGFHSIADIKAQGFEGFISIAEFLERPAGTVPDEKGVYMMLYISDEPPVFKKRNKAGRFRGQNPSADREVLKKNWVENSLVLFIGQAGGGNSSATLRSRIRQLITFGSGKPISHWDGRYLWQIKEVTKLVLCWQTTPDQDPHILEKKLINSFVRDYGTLPFANLND
jgi:hypothetical protein